MSKPQLYQMWYTNAGKPRDFWVLPISEGKIGYLLFKSLGTKGAKLHSIHPILGENAPDLDEAKTWIGGIYIDDKKIVIRIASRQYIVTQGLDKIKGGLDI